MVRISGPRRRPRVDVVPFPVPRRCPGVVVVLCSLSSSTLSGFLSISLKMYPNSDHYRPSIFDNEPALIALLILSLVADN